MAKRPASKSREPETVSLTIEIDEHLTLYSLGGRSHATKYSDAAVFENVTLIVWGSIVKPADKAGRVVQATLFGSGDVLNRQPTADGSAPEIGELYWGASRVANLWLPTRTIWPLVHEIGAGRLTRLDLTVDKPLRSKVAVRGPSITTRDFELATRGRATSSAGA